MSNRILIDQSNNTVTTDTTSTQNNVILSPDNPDIVRVVENTSNIVTIGVPGPRGIGGATGSQGPAGTDFYTTNGTVTGNRIVTLNDKQLVFKSNQSTLQNYTFNTGTPTGVTPSTWPASVIFEGEYLMNNNPEPYNTRVWGRNQSASVRSLWVNQAYADITSESTGNTFLFNQYFISRRGSQLDTGSAGAIHGVASTAGHGYTTTQNSTTTDISTGLVTTYQSFLQNFGGNITNAYSYFARTQISNSTVSNNTRNSKVTNLYNLYIQNDIGGNFATAVVTNLYAIYIATNVGATGTITNRWGVYAPDSVMKHYLNGNLSLGTSETGSNKLLVVGSTKLNGSVDVTGSITLSDVLILPYNNPLPSGKPTGSLALSGSGATFIGMYAYDGTSWIKLSV